MKKKIISLILTVVVVFCLFIGITSISVVAKADTGFFVKDLFEATNTYDLDGNITKIDDYSVYHDQMGYDNPQYSFEYDFSAKNANTTTTVPYVTVFTHGYYSKASDWCNNAENLPDGASFDELNFEYSVFSMVHQVATEVYTNNAVVVRAIMEKNSQENSDYKITIEQEYCDNPNFLKPDSELTMENINEIGNYHLIVIFDGYKTDGSNDNIYYQLNYMLSSILYKLKDNYNGRIPKVNLIGHSRGGITNMQYALDHPDIVANLISIGTPYNGSTTAVLSNTLGISKGDGLNDIIDPDKYRNYRERWNNGYNTLYKNINTLAIGAFSSLPFLSKIAHGDRSGVIQPRMAKGIDYAVAIISALKARDLIDAVLDPMKLLKRMVIRAVNKVLKCIFAKSVVFNVADIFLNEMQLAFWYSDIIVPLDSQMGILYNGFHRFTKVFTTFGKYNLERVAQWDPPVVHNLEPWDEEIINRVVEELKPSVTDGTENFKYKENSDGTINISGLKAAADSNILDIPAAINGKTVRGISSGAFAGEPSVIGKLNASNANVASYAANSENYLANVTTINIPSTVTNISADAFSGMESLTTVNFGSNSQLNTIGENAFADCVNLKNISLPSGITEIPYGAFENCKELESVTIPSGVTKIGAQAFCGAEKLSFTRLPASVTEIGELAFFGCKGSSSIALPSGVTTIGDGAFAGIENVTTFTVSGTNANYTTKNGVLYNKAKTELLQYPKAKTGASFIINGEDSANTVSKIKSYAFYKCENLTYVNINNVREIESLAFADCSALSRINAWGVNKASVDAFTNTSWLETQISDESCDQIVLDHILLLYIPEDKTEMGLSDWDSNIGTIGENAFAFSDLETIYVPSRVSRWSDNAFANIPTLKDVYIEKMDEDLLYKIGVQENLFGNNHADLKLHVTRSDNEAIAAMGQSALSDIPREVISTNVTCINNGVTTTQTIYYDEEYTLAGNGSVVWENEAGERYQNTGVWKRFETELTLNSLQVNNSWLTYNGENKSPVALVEGDVVSLSYTESGVVTATVNGQVYKINVSLVGRRISGFKMSGGQVVTSVNAVTYSGQFTSFNIETAVIDYELRCNYVYYYNSSSKRLYTENVSYTINKLDDVNEVMRLKNTIVLCKLADFDLDKEYYVEAFYSDYACTNQVTTPQLFNETLTDIYLKCTKIVTSVEFDYNGAKAKEIVRLKYYEFNASGKYNLTFPSYSKTGFTGSWQDVNSPDNKYACGSTKEINSNNNYNYKIFWTCSGEHSITINSTGDTQHKEKCSKCDYEAVSNHNIIIWGSTDDLFAHTRRCKKLCGYEEKEAHNWQPYNKMFKCTICNIKATTIPSIYDSLKFMIIDEQGNVKEISREEAMLIMKKYELEEEGDVAA